MVLEHPIAIQPQTRMMDSLASKSVEKGPLFTFSSASVGSESSGLNAAQSEVELQTVSRCASGRSNGACQSQMNAAK
ncbi:hypothetical protein FRX31_014449 [Thalictrum thalictroides]|uniref:Uncharacterized protein n=1 Tax=Thalictrum thalictroides TaxID=46969 RepID=A0A7J6WG81_THATH|nr:hypothetical protein FRX31_014449 [Thalictrum thalictroides]